MTDVERLAIDYAAKASVYRESAEAYSTSKSGEMRIAADAHKSLADDCAIIAAALRDAADRERGCEYCRGEDCYSYRVGLGLLFPRWVDIWIGKDRVRLRTGGNPPWKFCPNCGKRLTGGKA